MKTKGEMGAGRLFKVCVLMIFGYLITYCLVMRRDYPAIDANGEVAFKSAFLLAPVATTMVLGHTSTYAHASLANYFYLPADYLYHKWNPTVYKQNAAERDFKPKDWFVMR